MAEDRTRPPKFQPFVVFSLLETDGAYVVGPQDGLIIGMPRFYRTREEAQKRADELNKMHGIGILNPSRKLSESP